MIYKKALLTLTSVLALGFMTGGAMAQDEMNTDPMDGQIKAYSKTIEKKVIVKPDNTDLLAYDLNGNGTLEPAEVGTKLFYQFDRDGNQTIDNREFTRELMISFAPVEKTSIMTVDFNNDGVLEAEEVETDVIMQKTGLGRFDTDGTDGVSPREFLGKSFLQLDLDNSGMIELSEWKNAYMNQMAPKSANNEIYND